MTLEQLRAHLKAKFGEAEKAQTKAYPKEGTGTAEDQKAYEDLLTECESIEKQIERLERQERIKASTSKLATDPVQPKNGPKTGSGDDEGDDGDDEGDEEAVRTRGTEPRVKQRLTAKNKTSLIIMAAARAKRIGWMSPMAVLEASGHGELAKEIQAEMQKALNTGTAADGGVFLPQNVAREIIPMIRAESVIMQGRPRLVPLTNGNLIIPGQQTGASAAYVGETQPIPVSQPTFRSMSLSLKKLAGIVPVSNELIADSAFGMNDMVADDLVAGINLTGDAQMLRGVGSAAAPTGILNLVPAGQKLSATGVSTAVAIEALLRRAIGKVRTRRLGGARLSWIMSGRTLGYLETLRDPTGALIFPTLAAANPTLYRIPVIETEQVPENLGAGTNESEIYLIDFNQVYVAEPSGQNNNVAITTSDEATVVVASTPISAYQNDLTLVRGIVRHDIDLRYEQAVVIIQNVTWGV